MVMSGTLAPPIKTTGNILSGYVLAAVSLMGGLTSMADGDPSQPWLVKTCAGMITTGVMTRVVVAVTRTCNEFFSCTYFDQFSATMIAVGVWLLAAGLGNARPGENNLLPGNNITSSLG
jgi:hypothetical protein